MPDNDLTPTLNHIFFRMVELHRRERHLSFGDVHWSTERFVRAVYGLNRYLLGLGLESGDRVAILSENRPEWHVADFAALLGRLVVVPVYATLAPAQAQHILRHSGTRVVVVSNRKQADLIASLRPSLPRLDRVVSMEEIDDSIPSISRLSGPAPGESDWRAFRETALAAVPDETATIVYTSGTTGTPKGVMLSHGNIVFDVKACNRRLEQRTASQALSVLPLSHVLERLLGYGYFLQGVPIAYGDPHDLKRLLRVHKPEVMGCVPRILERVKLAVEEQIEQQPRWRRNIARAAIGAAIRCDRQPLEGTMPPTGDRLLRLLARAVVYPKVRRRLGGIRYWICGGAWLDPGVEHFFRAGGFTVIQGYGLTETSPVITVSDSGGGRPGTVGRPLDGVEVSITGEGEILTRGGNVMKGYFEDPLATAAAFDGGWLRTGDLGRWDEHGNLVITGRSKEILVLSTGKNVSCTLVEQALQRSEFIQTCLVVGDGQKYLSAFVIPDRQRVEAFAAGRGISAGGYQALLASRQVIEMFRGEIERHQSDLSHYERVKRFCFLDERALLDPELVTPSDKVRRAVLARKYADWISRMLEETEPLYIPCRSGIETPAVNHS